jgi:hypothetical protein
MSANGQEQKVARQIDGDRSSPIWDMATVVTGPNSAILQPKVFAPNAPLRHREFCVCRLARRQVGPRLVVEPEQIGIKPHMTDDVIRHYGIDGVGEVARLPRPPTGFRTKKGAIDRDRKMFTGHDIAYSA